MGLAPMGTTPWFETDDDIGRYHRHKLEQRALRGTDVYRASEASRPAQHELAQRMLTYLLQKPGCAIQLVGAGGRLPGATARAGASSGRGHPPALSHRAALACLAGHAGAETLLLEDLVVAAKPAPVPLMSIPLAASGPWD